MFGADGRLYIASVGTPGILVMDPESGAIEDRWGPEQGVKGPDDLAFGPDGSLYWTDITFGEVARRSPDGTTTVIANLGPGVNPITFSDDGRLFVSQCFFDDKLYEVDPAGETEPRLITDRLGPGCGLNGMDWGPDGFLYGPRWFHGEVARVNVDTGEVETAAQGFDTPAAVKFDAEGRLHVLDTLAGEVVRVDLESGAKEVVGRVQPSSADNLAFDDSGRLFVSSFADGFIVEVVDAVNTRTVSPGGLNMPGGVDLVATEEGEALFVADFFAIRQLDPATGEVQRAVRGVIGMSELGTVMTVHGGGEHLVLTSWFDDEVKLWDAKNERMVAKLGGFQGPIDAVPFGSDLVVSEYGTGSVLRVNAGSPDDRTVLAGGLQEPAGIAVAGQDLYATDRGRGEIVQIFDDGNLLDPPRVVASDLSGPEGIDVGSDGTLYVVEATAGRVATVDPETGAKTVLAEDLELHVEGQGELPSTMLFNGIAVGDGQIFVTGDRANVLYRIDL
jgi:sugar lactone lactonase YvrE